MRALGGAGKKRVKRVIRECVCACTDVWGRLQEKTNSASERVALTDMKMEEAAATAKRMEDESKDARAAAIKLEEENARLRNELAEMRRVSTELAARKIPAPASGTAAPAMAQGNQRAVQWLPVPVRAALLAFTVCVCVCVCVCVLTPGCLQEQKMTVSKSVLAVPGEALAQNIEVDGDGVAALEQVQCLLGQMLNILRTHTRSLFTCVCAYVLNIHVVDIHTCMHVCARERERARESEREREIERAREREQLCVCVLSMTHG